MSRFERALRAIYDIRFLLVVVIVTLLIAILLPIKQNRINTQNLKDTVSATRQTQLDNTDTNQRIRDCVDPNGACAKAGRERLDRAIKRLLENTIIANACSVVLLSGPEPKQTLEEIEKSIRECIANEMKKGRDR